MVQKETIFAKVSKLVRQVQNEGPRSVARWGVRWVYWNGRLNRLPWQLRRGIESFMNAPITDSTLEWCKRHPEIPLEILNPAQDISIAPPRTVEPVIAPEFIQRAQQYRVNPKFVAEVPQTRLVGENGQIILPDGSFAAEIANGAINLMKDNAYLNSFHWPHATKKGKYFSFMMEWCNSGYYYHWMHDILLKAYLVIDSLPQNTRYIVPARLNPLQLETLRILGIAREQLEFYDGNIVLELESQYLSPPTTWSGYDLLAADNWLRQKIFSAYGIQATQRNKRIYISRRQTRQRAVINEASVLEFLSNFGFELYCLEEMTLREQAELFAAAEIIIGPHGGGLTNVLFAPSNAIVIEFFAPAHFRAQTQFWCYWMMSTTLGLEYWYVLCQGQYRPGSSINHDDLIVPIHKLQATLEHALQRTRARE